MPPRAFPTCSGPVGLADTNSTFTERGFAGAGSRPQASGSARTVPIIDSSAVSRSLMLRKPGGATSADATGVAADGSVASAVSSVARAVAIANGAIRYGRASFIARLVARSPWTGSAGRSTSTAGRTASSGHVGSAPAATARSHARPTAAPACARIGSKAVGGVWPVKGPSFQWLGSMVPGHPPDARTRHTGTMVMGPSGPSLTCVNGSRRAVVRLSGVCSESIPKYVGIRTRHRVVLGPTI
jgi:hypothetical protein